MQLTWVLNRFENHDYKKMRNYFLFAFKNDSHWILNRGVISAFLKTIMKNDAPEHKQVNNSDRNKD